MNQGFQPSYISLYKNGELQKRRDSAYQILESCSLCPRRCEVNRIKGENGFCRTGSEAVISSFGPHFGEESPLVGLHGSGTIFITHCNLGCVFCQNYDISHMGEGREISCQDLARIMLYLQKQGCHNINLVSPTHVVPQILDALILAAKGGLSIPLVYNSGGYDSTGTIELLEGVFDIYMPDFKLSGQAQGKSYAQAPDYFESASAAILEMHRQVGDLKLDSQGIAYQGILIRHLVLPDHIAGTKRIMQFISSKLSRNTYINIMDQYRPCGEAGRYPELNRRITPQEYQEAVGIARNYGLYRLDERIRLS
jgi:putative pyruvate formate lyase activating enzyme